MRDVRKEMMHPMDLLQILAGSKEKSLDDSLYNHMLTLARQIATWEISAERAAITLSRMVLEAKEEGFQNATARFTGRPTQK